jgi:Putative Actinobacterial Holin-X, holin superfamily III
MPPFTNSTEPTLTEAIRGVANEFSNLCRQQTAMFRAEFQDDWRSAKGAAFEVAMGLIPLALSAMLICFMLVHLLHWLGSPAAAQPTGLPLWVCYGIVGALLGSIGGFFIGKGIRTFSKFSHPLDDSMHALEENVRWLTKRM